MPDAAFAKIEEAVKAVLVAATGEEEPLEGYSVLTDWPEDEAIEGTKVIVIATVGLLPQQAEELNQTYWNQTLQIEVLEGPLVPGTISRTAQNALASIHALLAADRTLGGRLQDLQEIDIAGTQAEGKDVHGASVQYRSEFYTSRDDWLTILGHGGATF